MACDGKCDFPLYRCRGLWTGKIFQSVTDYFCIYCCRWLGRHFIRESACDPVHLSLIQRNGKIDDLAVPLSYGWRNTHLAVGLWSSCIFEGKRRRAVHHGNFCFFHVGIPAWRRSLAGEHAKAGSPRCLDCYGIFRLGLSSCRLYDAMARREVENKRNIGQQMTEARA